MFESAGSFEDSDKTIGELALAGTDDRCGRGPQRAAVDDLCRLGCGSLALLALLAGPASASPPALTLEPDVYAVQRAARQREYRVASGLLAQPPRWAAALPTRMGVTLSGLEDQDRTSTEYEDGLRRKIAAEQRLTWRVELVWDLSQVGWNPVDAAAARAHDQVRRRADDVVDRVTRLYFDRRALQLQYLQGSLPDSGREAARWARILEFTAQIDALTDGILRRAAVQWWLRQIPAGPDAGAGP
ncbi:MAG: hypothetical protein ACI9WU_001164 [Myxococcota bacterium]